MATFRIQDFEDPTEIFDLPVGEVPRHKDLIEIAHGLFGKTSASFNSHIHLIRKGCEAKDCSGLGNISSFLYDKGVYLKGDDNLFAAHFTSKNTGNSTSQALNTSKSSCMTEGAPKNASLPKSTVSTKQPPKKPTNLLIGDSDGEKPNSSTMLAQRQGIVRTHARQTKSVHPSTSSNATNHDKPQLRSSAPQKQYRDKLIKLTIIFGDDTKGIEDEYDENEVQKSFRGSVTVAEIENFTLSKVNAIFEKSPILRQLNGHATFRQFLVKYTDVLCEWCEQKEIWEYAEELQSYHLVSNVFLGICKGSDEDGVDTFFATLKEAKEQLLGQKSQLVISDNNKTSLPLAHLTGKRLISVADLPIPFPSILVGEVKKSLYNENTSDPLYHGKKNAVELRLNTTNDKIRFYRAWKDVNGDLLPKPKLSASDLRDQMLIYVGNIRFISPFEKCNHINEQDKMVRRQLIIQCILETKGYSATAQSGPRAITSSENDPAQKPTVKKRKTEAAIDNKFPKKRLQDRENTSKHDLKASFSIKRDVRENPRPHKLPAPTVDNIRELHESLHDFLNRLRSRSTRKFAMLFDGKGSRMERGLDLEGFPLHLELTCIGVDMRLKEPRRFTFNTTCSLDVDGRKFLSFISKDVKKATSPWVKVLDYGNAENFKFNVEIKRENGTRQSITSDMPSLRLIFDEDPACATYNTVEWAKAWVDVRP